MKITFLGAVEGVTGSRYLVENADKKILVDCGIFQGIEENKRKRDYFPLDPRSIDAIVLTHAHIDHTGFIPRIVKEGFNGRIYCSEATFELCKILFLDIAKIEEEKEGKYPEFEPLYTIKDAEDSFSYFKTVSYDMKINLGGSLTATLIRSGHILGSSFVIIDDGNDTLTFSGDLGRPEDFIMKARPPIKQTDYLVLESTYGNRLHSQDDPIDKIGEVVRKSVEKSGVVIIPSFAVARTQTILYILYQLKEKGMIPDCPIFLDSPMAIAVTKLYCKFMNELKISESLCHKYFNVATYTESVKESKQINGINPAIIVAGSGMSEGGRVLHHFKHLISDNRNTVLFVGYQAEGTLGRLLTEGIKEIKLFGKSYKVKASIKKIDMLSAHADYGEVLKWLSHFESPPKKTFLTHGEIDAAESLKKKIEDRFGWKVILPSYRESFELS